MSKQEKIEQFDPNGIGLTDSGLFGLPFEVEEAEVVVLPVPWDVTTSYRDGTSNGPEAILWASRQVDLYYSGIKDAWKMGIAMRAIPMEWSDLNKHYRKKANSVIEKLENGVSEDDPEIAELIQEINEQSSELNEYVYSRSKAQLEAGKLVAVLGGDHSTPLGLIRALSEQHESFGILQIDAHADLRDAYEGFEYSHASIMNNALKNPQVSKLVAVGLRDVCQQEMEAIFNSNDRIVGFFDEQLKARAFAGETWSAICDSIISELPQKVYISFDIDGLEPSLCPNTGTPVPGGLTFEQAIHLIKKVVESGRTIVGLDLCEVAPSESEWDTNVGARLLYHLCNQMGLSNGRMPAAD
ncbi:MAG: agmatinase family protein [Flavobacteriales bacterium]|nr:agmatinase family protein [Flavobacteriales bacterium]MCB9192264.1 agmatinase family protein [Flavobacteriales bacterium]